MSKLEPEALAFRRAQDQDRGSKRNFCAYMAANPLYFKGAFGRKYSKEAAEEEFRGVKEMIERGRLMI